MKLGTWNQRKMTAIALSAGFVILTAMSVWTQEQKDPFKKEQAGKTENAAQPPQRHEVPIVSIEMRMIEMPRLAADELFKEQGGLAKTYVINEKTLGAISDMVIKSKAKVVSQSKVITKSGANCENKSVGEFIYPTEYNVSSSSETNSVKALSGILIPMDFQTRDIGTILNVTPTVGPGNQVIDLVVLPQRVRLSACPNKVIVNSPAGKIEVEQPVFLSENVTTSLTIRNGTTVLVSVCDATSNLEKQEKAGENIILVIMTASIVPVGEYIRPAN